MPKPDGSGNGGGGGGGNGGKGGGIAFVIDGLTDTSDTGTFIDDDLTNLDTGFVLTGTVDPSVGSFTLIIDGQSFEITDIDADTGAWSFTYTGDPLADGAVLVEAEYATTNKRGRETTTSADAYTFTIDSTIATPVIDSVSATADGLVISGTAEAGSTVDVFIGSSLVGTVTADPSGAWSFDYVGPVGATATITASSTDDAGNGELSAAYEYTNTPTAPDAPVITGIVEDTGADANDGVTNVAQPTVTGTAAAGATVRVLVDGVEVGTTTADQGGGWSFVLNTVTTDGTYAITATAEFAGAPPSPASTAFTVEVDRSAPDAPAGLALAAASDTGSSDTDALTADTTPTITGTAEAGALVTLLADGVAVGSAVAGTDGTWTITASALADGVRSLSATATDRAGNTSAASAPVEVEIDTQTPAPEITAVLMSDGTDATGGVTDDPTPEVRGAAEAGATVILRSGATVLGTATADAGGNWSIIVGAVLADGLYDLQAEATDRAGNTALSAPLAMEVDAIADLPQNEPQYGEMWHLAELGGIEDVWAEYDGSGVHVAVYDDGIEYDHVDLNDNYDAASHLVFDGLVLDPYPANADEAKHGTAAAGVIAAEANGLGTVGVAYGATLTGVNIFTGPANINAEEGQTAGFEFAIGEAYRFDITSNSWGSFPVYLFDTLDVIIAAFNGFKTAAETGRGGLGTINVKAAGNAADSSQGDALDPTRYTLTVAAHDSDRDASWYTSRGANVLVSAPSSGHTITDGNGDLLPESDLRIATTDRAGEFGYGPDDWSSATNTSGFGGTSSATPTVAGVVALMLDANPNLGWRDVQDILAYSARHIGGEIGVANTATEVVPRDADFDGTFETTAPQLIEFDTWKYNGATDWNGGGLHQSNDYGMGAVHAHDAVRMAEVWGHFTPGGPSTSANEVSVSGGRYENQRTILDDLAGRPQHPDAIIDPALENSWFGRPGDPTSFTYTMDVTGTDMTLDYVDLYLHFNTVALADLTVTLTSPGGTQITLMDEPYNDYAPQFTSRVYLDWTFGAHAFKGEDPNGTWTLYLEEFRLGNTVEGTDIFGNPTSVSADGNRIVGVELTFHGDAGSASSTAGDDTWTYTDEVFDALADQPGRLTLTDDGGTDWINAAAMTGDIILNLGAAGGGSTGGQTFLTIDGGTVIENAVTGDGNDRITGGNGANTLMGMRGDDILEGAGGNDVMTGGTGSDTFVFGALFGSDRITDFEGGAGMGDVLDLAALGEVSSLQEFIAASSEIGGNAVYDLDQDGVNVLQLDGISLADLAADDFLFGTA